MNVSLIFVVILLNVIKESVLVSIRNDKVLVNRPFNNRSSSPTNFEHFRRKRYLGLSKRFKINKRYQECVAPDDAKGHCKHLIFCPMHVLKNAKNVLDYLCVIERMHVGVCCPDDIALSGLAGSQIISDLPGGGDDYDEKDNTTGCGIPIEGNPGGKKSIGQQWPWIAALYRPKEMAQGLEQQFCGGSVITEYHILTAAHCTLGLTADEIRVRLGEYNFAQANESRSVDHIVESITDHEDFDKATYANDISIIKLRTATSFNSYIWPICLPPIDRDFVNEVAIVAGWGQVYYAGPVSEVLRHVEVPVWTLEKCANSFLQRITDSNLCAAGYDGGKDSCLGDSGGPLMFQLENGRWITIGIVSWGIGCGNKGSPGIYTKVSSYIPWIIKNTIAK
ncbi:hypothetical protein MTP99_019604 [Tenebrio molitor]|jgi:hypothetical protein|uniref:Phenoloxidase-activating factor 2 n=1 Tax=Tenebrio molitor TaxID=7067 RepID=A0A8F2D9F9_TENMO|nr:hypothetical protein MTP99_019604 [Tenebrio molitor]QWS65016.1 trypsin-like serine peptidase [Tenebrio molitor]CAH1378247.1 unnamed protein product [Tenebrio molitor]